MDDSDSPQLRVVGEALQNQSEKRLGIGNKPSFAALLVEKQSAGTTSKLELSPVLIQNGTPTVEFSLDEVNSFTREEGLHQGVIIKFSYGKPAIYELRQMLPRLFDVKGNYNIGLLEHRHILVRLDLFEDFVKVVSRTSGYVRYRGDDFSFRTFPWTMRFNPREEMSKAVVWISFPDLPANFFARKSLMSIASAVGKPLAVDKATNERTRPSTARVKVLINLLDNHPKKVKIKVVDIKTGNLVEYDQKIVIDNLPKYCTYCLHQDHDKNLCRWMSDDSTDKTVNSNVSESKGNMLNLGRDARELLNEIKAGRRGEMVQLTRNKDVAKKNVDVATVKLAESVQLNKESTVMIQQKTNALTESSLADTPPAIQQVSPKECTSIQQNTVSSQNRDHLVSADVEPPRESVDLIAIQNAVGSTEHFSETAVRTSDVLASNANADSLGENGSKLTAEGKTTSKPAERLNFVNCCDVSHPAGSNQVSQMGNSKMQPNVSSDIQCEMIQHQMPVVEEGLLTSDSAAVNVAVNAQPKTPTQHTRTNQRSNLKSSDDGHQLTSKNVVNSKMLIDFEPSAETYQLVENSGEPVQQQNTVPLGRGEPNQPVTMQPSHHGLKSEAIGSGSNLLEQSAGQKSNKLVTNIFNSHPKDLHMQKESTQKKIKQSASKSTALIPVSNSVAAIESKCRKKEGTGEGSELSTHLDIRNIQRRRYK